MVLTYYLLKLCTTYIAFVLFGVSAWRLMIEVYSITVGFSPTLCLKKNQKAPRPSEHPPVRGGGGVKTFIRWDQRLQKNTKPLHGI